MPRILFLITPPPAMTAGLAHNDNAVRLPAAFREAGWETVELEHDSIGLRDGHLVAGAESVTAFERVWVLGLGRVETFFDRMQLLHRAPQKIFITPIDAYIYQHAKYAWAELMPETHALNDPKAMARIVAAGGDWVAKPAAGSFGRDVVRVRDDAEGRAVLERLTGGAARRYCLLQRYVPGITNGEKRTLIAGRSIIGSYLRLPGPDFRTNLSLGGQMAATALDPEECQLVERVHAQLIEAGIGFAAIDTAGGYLMEVNLANPGGLASLQAVYGRDFTPAVVAALTAIR